MKSPALKVVSASAVISLSCLLGAHGQEKGKTSDLSKVFLSEEVKPFKYLPVDPAFWKTITQAQETKNFVTMVNLGAEHESDYGSASPEGAEGRLAIARGLLDRKFYYGAFYILRKLAQEKNGTNIGSQALEWLGEITQKALYPKSELESLMVTVEFSGLHPSIQSFVSYHRAIYASIEGFRKWAKRDFGLVQENSYWNHLLNYWKAVGWVARDKIELSKTVFQKIKNDESIPLNLREQAALQYSRLLFEEGHFQAAFDIYSVLQTLNLREQGRVDLERAWTKYYLKDYSQALGILTALKAPYYSPSINPERYILEMIIYKELCHYNSVKLVTERFRSDFGESLKRIKTRKPLKSDPQIFYMSMLTREYQEMAQFIHQVREEADLLQGYNWSRFAFYEEVLEAYTRIDKSIQTQIDQHLEQEARKVANELLDAEEQVLFLDYTARLDSLRIIPQGEERSYKSESVSHFVFDKIYWPVESEFWTDELGSYKVLISSRCGQMDQLKGKETPDIEKEFQ